MYYQQNQCDSSLLMTAGGSNDSSILGGWYGVRLQLLMTLHFTEGRELRMETWAGDCLY